MSVIEVSDLTMDYGNGKGVFNLNFSIQEGEVLGYLGPNGAGKTTTIRCLLGFMAADQGSCFINNLHCFQKAPEIQRFLGYIPGEIAFFDNMNGNEFLKFMCDMRGLRDRTREKELIEMFELDIKGSIKKFSKGMKQKIGIITAFMHNPSVVILDEPTSGLDPLMQNRFIELLIAEKQKGTTMLMSSHIFEEVERTCDGVLIIKDGKIVLQSDVNALRGSQRKAYVLELENMENLNRLKAIGAEIGERAGRAVELFIKGENTDIFIKELAKMKVISMTPKVQSLEDIFLNIYRREREEIH